MDIRAPHIKAIADFLLHLQHERKLQACTIDGYRSAIADKLGNSPINVSKDENLTLLMDSFYRNRPKGCRAIPSSSLSLVLHQLTKASFEPLRGASLQRLTFKTVFLLALGSGSVGVRSRLGSSKTLESRQTGPGCLSTPHIASSRRTIWQRRVKTVWPRWLFQPWAPLWINHSKGDRSLCPVRALCYSPAE